MTTWASFTEAMHVLGARAGHRGQGSLWGLHHEGLYGRRAFDIVPADG